MIGAGFARSRIRSGPCGLPTYGPRVYGAVIGASAPGRSHDLSKELGKAGDAPLECLGIGGPPGNRLGRKMGLLTPLVG